MHLGGDAAQLFEEIGRDDVLRRLSRIVRQLRLASGAFGVVTKQVAVCIFCLLGVFSTVAWSTIAPLG